jgi:folate-dependent phosphoribosylglycinamide formyltransferase PurN
MIDKKNNILVICSNDNSKFNVTYDIIKYLAKLKIDNYYFLVVDRNKKILNFLKKKKKKIILTNFNSFKKLIKKDDYQWLLNIWSPIIYNKDFLKKFKFNLNLHPSYLPYNRGKDPYIWSIINQTPVGVTIHRMNHKIDAGEYYIRKKISLSFPYNGQIVYEKCLKELKRVFIKKWKKIRERKIIPKKYKFKTKLNYRKDLKKINYINFDKLKNISSKTFFLQCLAQDFQFLKQQIKFKNKIYEIKINLKKLKKL